MEIIGIGTDIEEIKRIENMLDKHGETFKKRVFTPDEILYSSVRNAGEHFAGRWAAKEAVLKAIGTGWIGGITWLDVEVCLESSGKPFIRLSGGAKEVADSLGIDSVLITISHSREYATAFAVAVKNS